MLFKGWRRGVGGLLVAFAFQAGAAAAAAPDSARLGRAKDYIADEQWTRAIAELRTVVADPKDKSRDEALYWLAHSLNQAGDSAAAITTIRRLEREYPTSLWVKPAGSLRVDIAVHLQRSDVLWWMAVPPAPPAPAAAAAPRAPSVPPAAPTPPVLATPPAPAVPPPPPPPGHRPLPPPAAPHVAPAFPTPPVPPAAWLPEEYRPDADIRIQALDRLMVTDATRVIPILKQIVLASENAREASRALFVLAQSGQARSATDGGSGRHARVGAGPYRCCQGARALRRARRVTGPDARLCEQRPGGEDAGGDVARRACRANGAPPDRQVREGPLGQGNRDFDGRTSGGAGGQGAAAPAVQAGRDGRQAADYPRRYSAHGRKTS